MSIMSLTKSVLRGAGIDPQRFKNDFLLNALKKAVREQGLEAAVEQLRRIVPDISHQYTGSVIDTPLAEQKVRALHAFQARLARRAVGMINKLHLNVVDIGDSSGNHLTYIRNVCTNRSFRTISVNLDRNAVEKIRAKGMEAVQCRAEELDLGNEPIDLFLTFEMVEHLMNPCLFFRRLAVRGKADYLMVTVPYVEQSRVGFHNYRQFADRLSRNGELGASEAGALPAAIPAEDEHVFEFSPLDWKLLMLFSGWKPLHDEVFLQYPAGGLHSLARMYWLKNDFPGFWGVILKRDISFSNHYKDWD